MAKEINENKNAIAEEVQRAKQAEKEINSYLDILLLDVEGNKSSIDNIKNQVARFDGNAFSATANEVKLTTTGVNTTKQWTVSLPTATTERAGVMSAKDKQKLDNLEHIGNSIKDIDVSPNESNVELDLTSLDDTTTHISIPAATTEKAGVMSAEDKETLDFLPIRLGDVNVIELEQSQFSNLIWNDTKFVPANNNYNSYILRIPEQTPLILNSVAKRKYIAFKEQPYVGYSPQDFINITNWGDYPEGFPSGYRYLVIQLTLSNSPNYDVVVTMGEHGLVKRISTLSKKIDEEIVPMINKVAAYETDATFSPGFILPNNGELPITDNSLYVHTLMDCIEGQKFIVSARATTLVFAWLFLDDSNNILTKYEGGNEPIVEAEIVAPFGAKKILVNSIVSLNPSVKFWNSNTPENVLSKEIKEVEETCDDITGILGGPSGLCKRVETLEDNIRKPLKGKTILCLGDSITEFRYQDKRYSDYLAEITGANVINGGIGGTHMGRRVTIPSTAVFSSNAEAYACLDLPSIAHSLNTGDLTMQEAAAQWLISDSNPEKTSDDNTAIIERLKGVDLNSVDIVTIFIGTNDIGGDLGEVGEKGDDTSSLNMSKGFYQIIKNLLTVNPNLRIYYYSPIPRYFGDIRTFDPENADTDLEWCDAYKTAKGYKFSEMVDHQIKLAEYFKIPVCDMYRTMSINQWNIASIMRGDISDGTHPYKGFKMLANKIASFIIANNNLNI